MQRSRWLKPLRFVAVMALLIAAGVPSCPLNKPKSPLAGQVRLPAFPDPLPPPAGSLELFDVLSMDLAEAHEHLSGALVTAGFDKWSVYAFKDGFALITRWEHIKEDGRPANDRFPVRHPKRVQPGFDLAEHAQLLFNSADGDYRLFVFTVAGSDPAMTASVPIDGNEVGPGGLPEEIADHPSADRTVTAHVYVYRQQGDSKAEPVEGSTIDAATHLTLARIFSDAELAAKGSP